MDLRAILARQAAAEKKSGPSPSTRPPPRTQPATQLSQHPFTRTPSSGSAATPHDSTGVDRKRKRPMFPDPEVVVLPSSQTLGGMAERMQEPSSGRSPASSPHYPLEYTADSNIFTAGPSNLGYQILHSLGSAAELQHVASSKLRPCTLEGCNDIVKGLIRVMNGLDRTALLHRESASEAEKARARSRSLSQEFSEFKMVHSATIDSLKSESDGIRDEVTEQRQRAERALAEAKSARDELEAYKVAEEDRRQAFLRSREFQEILGPKAFKFLKIGFQSCLDQFAEAGLLPADAAQDFPDIGRAITSVPDDILEDTPDQVVRGELDEGAEDPKVIPLVRTSLMEVWVPCNTPTSQNISGNNGFSLDPHNLTRCNARDITMNELKTCFTEFLNIQDGQKSTSGFCLSSDRNAIGNVVKKEDGHEDSNNGMSSSSASEKVFNEYPTFTPPGELEVEELFGGKEIQETDVSTELPEVNSSLKQSLPTPVKLVSAMKGNREKQGIPTKKLSVTWAPDVYDPVPASVSHFPSYNNQHCHSNGKKYGKNKLKGGSKSLRGSKGKDKKQARKNSAIPTSTSLRS